MSFVKEDADVDYISLDLHLIKCTLASVLDTISVSLLMHFLSQVFFVIIVGLRIIDCSCGNT